MIKKTIEYHMTDSSQDCTVEEFLKTRGYSHHLVVHLKKNPQELTVDHIPACTVHRLQVGERLRVTLTEEESPHNIVPVPLPLSTVYEDEDIPVVDKAAGIPVHPSQGHHDNTLANAVTWYYCQKGEPFTHRAVNRLDRGTTGLLVLAKHILSAYVLPYEMQDHNIKREYRTMMYGRTMEQGCIRSPITRVSDSTTKRAVNHEHGESAYTRYRRISYNEPLDLSYISLWLETGRTCQIRVHMKPIGHPLPGDSLYHPNYRRIKRQPLHSYELSFLHPVIGRSVEFTAELPQDMACLSQDQGQWFTSISAP